MERERQRERRVKTLFHECQESQSIDEVVL
jgi:hypothetical protein